MYILDFDQLLYTLKIAITFHPWPLKVLSSCAVRQQIVVANLTNMNHKETLTYYFIVYLSRWHAAVQQLKFRKMRHHVGTGLLQAVPAFGAALLQVSRLCCDLHRVSLLPHDAR